MAKLRTPWTCNRKTNLRLQETSCAREQDVNRAVRYGEVETDKFMSSAAGKLTYIYKHCLRLVWAWHDWTVPLSLCDMRVTLQSDGLWTCEKVES